MALLRVRRLCTSGVRCAGWRFWRKSQAVIQSNEGAASPPPATLKPTPSEHLQQLTHTHMPHYTDNWRKAPLHTNLHMKTKILLSCEAQFDRSFPSSILGSLYTMGDVLKHLESHPPSPEPTSLFPNIDKGNLPPNLSIQTRAVPKKTQRRVPFQNYSRPESAEFPTKKQKDARARRGKVFR